MVIPELDTVEHQASSSCSSLISCLQSWLQMKPSSNLEMGLFVSVYPAEMGTRVTVTWTRVDFSCCYDDL